jgi:CHASE2 domain-containing sensor protein
MPWPKVIAWLFLVAFSILGCLCARKDQEFRRSMTAYRYRFRDDLGFGLAVGLNDWYFLAVVFFGAAMLSFYALLSV